MPISSPMACAAFGSWPIGSLFCAVGGLTKSDTAKYGRSQAPNA